MLSRIMLFALPISLVFIQSPFMQPTEGLVNRPSSAGPQTVQPPSITEARLEGPRLIVHGRNFSPESVILVNHARQITRQDDSRPSEALIAPGAGIKLGRDAVAVLQVQNPGGSTSEEFGFFTGRVVVFEDNARTITLKTGQKFLLHLKNEPYQWIATVKEPRVIRLAETSSSIRGSQGIYEALRPGKTSLTAEGELPCHKMNPPCMAATLAFEARFVVE